MLMKYKRPPDGGWGWAITFTACLTYAIAWSVPRGYSVLFKDFQENFKSTNYETSWIVALMAGFLCCGTLLGSVVTSILGARRTMMLGGLISCIGNVIISQATSLPMAYVGSITSGIGFGFAYCSGPSQVGMYFDKRRSLAFGIAALGAPANGILMPLFLVYLTQEYGWQGTVLITAGICLNLAVGGALLRPVLIYGSNLCKDLDCKDELNVTVSSTNRNGLKPKMTSRNDLLESAETNLDKQATDKSGPHIVDGMNFFPTKSKSTNNLHLNHCDAVDFIEGTVSVSLPHLPTMGKDDKNFIHKHALLNNMIKNPTDEMEDYKRIEKVPLYKNEAIKEDVDNVSRAVSQRLDRANNNSEAKSKLFFLFQPYMLLLRQWRFMLFSLVGFLDYSVRLIPTSFIVVHAQSQGLEKEEGALLLVVFAIFDCIIRPIAALATNRLPQARLRRGLEILMFGAAQATMFVLNMIAPHASRFSSLAAFMAMYGVTNGLNSIWCFPILSRLVPPKHLHHAVGIFHFCSGIGLLSGPPLAGFLADITGQYHAVFYLTSITMFVSCVFAWTLYGLAQKYGIRAKVGKQQQEQKDNNLI